MISFMLNIRFNNNKAFMTENRSEYQRLMRDPYYALIDSLRRPCGRSTAAWK